MARKNYFSIKNIILKGTSVVYEYELPAGTVLYRALSELEFDDAQSVLLGSIKDPATREYLLNLSETNNLEKATEVLDASEDAPVNIPIDVNLAELYEAMSRYTLRIVYLGISNFTDEFSEKDLKCLNGIRGLADKIMEVSGQKKEVLEEIEGFPEQP